MTDTQEPVNYVLKAETGYFRSGSPSLTSIGAFDALMVAGGPPPVGDAEHTVIDGKERIVIGVAGPLEIAGGQFSFLVVRKLEP